MTFWEACEKAKAIARGGDDTDAARRPATLAEALQDYGADLRIRGAGKANATVPLPHLSPAMLATPVALLTTRELKSWRNSLTKVMKASSANRVCKNVRAALNLAASHDDRIGNNKAWKVGLAQIPEGEDTESNLVLSDEQRRELVNAAYAISLEFGLYLEVHAAVGARTSQIALINVGDLHAGRESKLIVPSSLKGKNRRSRSRKPMPIGAGLTMRLKQAAAGRGPDEPLLMTKNGRRWTSGKHRTLFHAAAKAAGLPNGASMYCLRHTMATRLLLAGVPTRLVASSLDTSIAMLERTYSKFISSHGDELMRRAVFDMDSPAGNVVSLVR